jgi:CRP/FNR family transcriptional regulator, anaerobic regulatory protein
MGELEQYISSYFHVERNELEAIAGFFHPETLEKNAFFLKGGHYSDRLSFIRSGMLRVYAPSGDKDVTQWISTQGYFVTDLSSLLFETPARWTIQAITPVEMFTISKRDYQNLGKVIPGWHELEKLFIAKCFTILEDRIFSHLSMSAEERYNQLFEHNRELLNQVPLHYLASMLGMSAETFSRIRAKKI